MMNINVWQIHVTHMVMVKLPNEIIEAILYHYGLSQEKPDSFIAGK